MKIMKQILITVLSILSIHTAFADQQVLHFATEATYPPFEFVDSSGNLKGFDVDLAKALCKEMNMKCIVTSQNFNSLIPSLQAKKCDAIIGAIGVTPEREKEVAFTTSYYIPSASFVADKQNHYTLNDIPGKIVGVQAGTTFEEFLHKKYGDHITIQSYASIQDAFLDLAAGRVDVVLSDTPIVQTWLSQNSNNETYGVIDKPIVDETYFGSGYAIAVRQDNVELLKTLNAALVKVKANGTYDKIKKEYFPGS